MRIVVPEICGVGNCPLPTESTILSEGEWVGLCIGHMGISSQEAVAQFLIRSLKAHIAEGVPDDVATHNNV